MTIIWFVILIDTIIVRVIPIIMFWLRYLNHQLSKKFKHHPYMTERLLRHIVLLKIQRIQVDSALQQTFS
jgi:hypothetical protein